MKAGAIRLKLHFWSGRGLFKPGADACPKSTMKTPGQVNPGRAFHILGDRKVRSLIEADQAACFVFASLTKVAPTWALRGWKASLETLTPISEILVALATSASKAVLA